MATDYTEAKMTTQDKLKKLYPRETETVINNWAAMLDAHDADLKLPMTANMLAYKDLDSRVKTLEAEMKDLRAALIDEFTTLDCPVEGITHRVDERITWKHDVLFNWVETNHPKLLNDVRAKAIDIKLLEDKIASQECGLPDPTCYACKPIDVISVTSNRRARKGSP